jgi:hypothetical protein
LIFPNLVFNKHNGKSMWSERRDSNPRPQPWQGCALPTELLSQMSGRRGSNSRPIAWKAIALPTELLPLLTIVLYGFIYWF